MGSYMANHPIPYKFLDEPPLAPPSEEATRKLDVGTLTSYLGNWIGAARAKWPKHDLFPTKAADTPPILTELTKQVKKCWECNQLNIWKDGDYTFGNSNIKAVYRYTLVSGNKDLEAMIELSSWYGSDLDSCGAIEVAPVSMDLNSIFNRRISMTSPLYPESFRNITRDFVSWAVINRGGEVKFMRWSETLFHSMYEAWSHLKHQQKTLTGNTVTVCANPHNPMLDYGFHLGNHIFHGKGLQRSFQQRELEDVMFPDEHQHSLSGVS